MENEVLKEYDIGDSSPFSRIMEDKHDMFSFIVKTVPNLFMSVMTQSGQKSLKM